MSVRVLGGLNRGRIKEGRANNVSSYPFSNAMEERASSDVLRLCPFHCEPLADQRTRLSCTRSSFGGMSLMR